MHSTRTAYPCPPSATATDGTPKLTRKSSAPELHFFGDKPFREVLDSDAAARRAAVLDSALAISDDDSDSDVGGDADAGDHYTAAKTPTLRAGTIPLARLAAAKNAAKRHRSSSSSSSNSRASAAPPCLAADLAAPPSPPPLWAPALPKDVARDMVVHLPSNDLSALYINRKKLAQGGQGQVDKAKDATTGTPVALKIISRAYLTPAITQNPDVTAGRAKRANQEIAALVGPLRHSPYIINVHKVIITPDQVVLVMDLAVCDTRTAIEKAPKRGSRLARKFFIGTLKGLAAMQEAGLAHRDLKPANVLVLRDPHTRVVLADLGMTCPLLRDAADADAADADADAQLRRAAQSFVGTTGYMSPEMLNGNPELRAATGEHGYFPDRADMFAAGMCLYAWLTGDDAVDAMLTRANTDDIPAAVRHRFRANGIALPPHHETWDENAALADLVQVFRQKAPNLLPFPSSTLPDDPALDSLLQGLWAPAAKRLTLREAAAHRWVVRGLRSRSAAATPPTYVR